MALITLHTKPGVWFSLSPLYTSVMVLTLDSLSCKTGMEVNLSIYELPYLNLGMNYIVHKFVTQESESWQDRRQG